LLKVIAKIALWALVFLFILLFLEKVETIQTFVKNIDWVACNIYTELVASVLVLNLLISDKHWDFIMRSYFNKMDYLMSSIVLGYISYLVNYSNGNGVGLFYSPQLGASLIFWSMIPAIIRIMHNRFKIEDIRQRVKKHSSAPSARLDKPLGKEDNDDFNRMPLASQIGKMISSTKSDESMAIGLFGEWGAGKTSLLYLLGSFLETETNCIVVRYNSWFYKDNPNLIQELLNSITKEIYNRNGFQNHDIINTIADYAKKLSELKLGDSPASFKLIKDLFSSEKNVMELKEAVNKLLKEIDYRIVIIVDDLDRLTGSETSTVLQTVKLIGDFPNTTYILACDEDRVAQVISEQFYSKKDSKLGKDFLEKIIQVPIYLARPERCLITNYFINEIQKICKESDIALSDNILLRLKEIWEDSIGQLDWTMRRIKRLINVTTVLIPLQKGNVNIVDLIYLEALRLLFPDIYILLRTDSKCFLEISNSTGNSEIKRNKLNDVFKANHLDSQSIDIIKKLIIALFPKTKSLWSSMATNNLKDLEQKWLVEQRICSTKYFDNYFLYTVPSDMISDVVINDFINYALSEKPLAIQQRFEEITKHKNRAKVLSSLRLIILRRDDPYTFQNGLVQFIINTKWNIENSYYTSEWLEAILCIKTLTMKISEDNRLLFVEQIVEECIDIVFATDLFRTLRLHENELFDIDQQKHLGNVIGNIIQKHLELDGIGVAEKFIKFPLNFLSVWYVAEKEIVSKNLDILFEYDNTIAEFLEKVAEIGDLTIKDYRIIESIYHPDKVAKKIENLYGILEPLTSEHPDFKITKIRLAIQFMFFYKLQASVLEDNDIDDSLLE
jgi:predicted KAP-like P-loop ATPase